MGKHEHREGNETRQTKKITTKCVNRAQKPAVHRPPIKPHGGSPVRKRDRATVPDKTRINHKYCTSTEIATIAHRSAEDPSGCLYYERRHTVRRIQVQRRENLAPCVYIEAEVPWVEFVSEAHLKTKLNEDRGVRLGTPIIRRKLGARRRGRRRED